MIKKRINKKPILLLFLLLGFSFFVIKILEKYSIEKKKIDVHLEQPQQCESCKENNSTLQEEVIDEITEDDIVLIDKANTVNIVDTSVVKGVKNFSCDNISADTLLASIRKTCSSGAGEVDYANGGNASSSGSGVVVSKDSVIEIVEINYPLSLFLGQSTYQDSNKQIRKESPEYRSNGQQIDIDYVTRNLSPKESEKFSASLLETEKVPFKVEAEVSVGGADQITSSNPGEYVIRNAPHEPECTVKGKPCERELAISDFNVEKTNNLAADSEYGGYYMFQAPGGDNYKPEEDNSCLVQDTNYTYWSKGVVNSCKRGLTASVSAIFKRTFSASKWKRCTVGEPITNPDGSTDIITDTCIDVKNIGIKMTAIFGDPYECTEDLCANAMLVDRYRSVLAPQEATGKKEVSTDVNTSLTKFVATDCAISIDGKTYPVYCLWDASTYLLNYQLQAKDSIPNQEDFPQDFQSYWNSVKKSSDMSAEKYGLVE